MTKVIVIAEQIFTVFAMVFLTGGPFNVIFSGGASEGDYPERPTEFVQLQFVFFSIYLVTILLLALRWKKVVRSLPKGVLIWLLLAIAFASILWSSYPAITLNRSIVFAGTNLFGLYIATRYKIEEQLNLLMWTFGTILVLSIIYIVALPKYGIMGGIHTGAWRGIYVHKNVFGKMMVLSVLTFWIQATSVDRKSWWPLLGLSCSIFYLLLARSTTSIINTVTLLALIPIYQTLRLRYHLMIPAVIAIVTIGGGLSMWTSANAADLLGTIGKDPTLTGRTGMWPYMWEMFEKQPWLGYGYDGFWQDWNSPGAYIWRAINWTAPNAHNGYLNLLLELGVVGLSVYLLGFFVTSIGGFIWLRHNKSSEGFWPLLYLTYIFLTNLSESALLERNNIFWVLYVATAISVSVTPQQRSKTLSDPSP